MCTAATYKTKDFYFGRTLDYEFSYGEEIVVMPRRFPLNFSSFGLNDDHFAVIGTAHCVGDYPLFYDGLNEKGLAMAGLNFVGNAHYAKAVGENCVAQYEFIPFVLANCENVAQARELIGKIILTDTPFSPQLPSAQLHWIIADKNSAVVVECVKDGMKIHDDPVGVLTNNPPFEQQMFRLNDFMSLSPRQPENNFSDKLSLEKYSRGMGAMGLPGDLSSQSRFVRAAFVKMNSVSGSSEEQSVSQFFHILGSVDQQRGCCDMGDGKYEITIYTNCYNADKGIYYYTTYDNHQICAVDMHAEQLDGTVLARYTMKQSESIFFHNR